MALQNLHAATGSIISDGEPMVHAHVGGTLAVEEYSQNSHLCDLLVSVRYLSMFDNQRCRVAVSTKRHVLKRVGFLSEAMAGKRVGEVLQHCSKLLRCRRKDVNVVCPNRMAYYMPVV